MMLEMVYASDRDAAMRLDNTVVNYKGVPVYVLSAKKGRTLICDMDGGRERQVKTENLDITPVKIGNVQIGGRHVYVQRSPIRRWKQGLHRESLIVGRMPFEQDIVPRLNLMSVEVLNAIIGNFGDVKENMSKVIKGQFESCALNRHWAVANVKGVPRLMYKDKMVGFVEGEEIIISKKWFFLKEDLLEVLNA